MKKNNHIFLALLLSLTCGLSLLFAQPGSQSAEAPAWLNSYLVPETPKESQNIIKFAISHGHCSLPFEGPLSFQSIRYSEDEPDNPKIDFEVGIASLVASDGPNGEWTQKIRSEKYFHAEKYRVIRFSCKGSYSLGKDWYMLDGTMTIRNKALPIMLRATPVFSSMGCRRVTKYVVDGKVNLDEFGVPEGREAGLGIFKSPMYINLVVDKRGC